MNKMKVAEYSSKEFQDGPSVETRVLKTGVHKINGLSVELQSHTEGWICAGSMARWQKVCYSVCFTDNNGCKHGSRYTNTASGRSRAERKFRHMTKV